MKMHIISLLIAGFVPISPRLRAWGGMGGDMELHCDIMINNNLKPEEARSLVKILMRGE